MEIGSSRSLFPWGLMRRYRLWGNWVLQRRKKSVGTEGLWVLLGLLVHIPELFMVFLVLNTLMLQLRRKLLAVLSNLFASLDAQALRGDNFADDPHLSRIAPAGLPPSISTIMLMGLAVALLLLVIGLIVSRRARRLTLEVLVVALYLGGLAGLAVLLTNPLCATSEALVGSTFVALGFGLGYLLSTFRLRRVLPEIKKGGGFRHPPSPHRN